MNFVLERSNWLSSVLSNLSAWVLILVIAGCSCKRAALGKGCVTFLARKGDSPMLFLDCFLGLRNRDWVQELSWRCSVFLHTKNAMFVPNLIVPVVRLGSKVIHVLVQVATKWEQVSNTHQVFIQESVKLFLPTLLFLITGSEAPGSAKGEKSQNIWDNGRQNLIWFWVVWWGFLRIGAKGITLHLASLPVNR